MRLKPSQEKLEREADPEESSGGHADDGLDALASELRSGDAGDAREASNEAGNEAGDELDDEVDLAKLSATSGVRPSTLQDEPAAAAVPEAPKAPATDRSSSKIVPALVALALGLGVLGFVLGRTSREPAAPQAPAMEAAEPAAAPNLAQPSVAVPTQAAPAFAAQIAAPASATAAAHAAPEAVAERPAAVSQPLRATGDSSDSARARVSIAPTAGSPEVKAPATASSAASPRRDALNGAPVLRVQPSPAPAAPATQGAAASDEAPTPFDLETAALAAVEASKPSGTGAVDALLNEALDPAARKQRERAEPTEASLPETPSREEVTQTMAVLLPAIRGCAMGQTGIAEAGIVVRGDGRVASVELSGAPFAGTASGRCMEGVIRRARFSRFRQPTFRVRFPFAIQ